MEFNHDTSQILSRHTFKNKPKASKSLAITFLCALGLGAITAYPSNDKCILLIQTGISTCTLKCLSIGTPETISFPFVPNGKLMILTQWAFGAKITSY